MAVQRKGRTLSLTVGELLESPRWKIAMSHFEHDQSFMRAILIELGYEAQNVAKSTIIKQYALHNGLDQYELIPMLRSVNEFNTYGIFWGLSEAERLLYQNDPKFKLTEEERKVLLDKVHSQLMESNQSAKNE